MLTLQFLQNTDINSIDANKIQQKFEQISSSGNAGFFDLPNQDKQLLNSITDYIKSLNSEINTFLLIGIGGSSLGCITINSVLKKIGSNKKFYCLDNIDGDLLSSILADINPEETIVNVVSKSGGTPETMSNFMVVYAIFKEKLGLNVNQHFVFTTDPAKGLLNEIANKEQIQTFHIPENVGGRFSILSPVGLLMSEFMGYDTSRLLAGANKLREEIKKPDNFIYRYAASLFIEQKKNNKNISILMPYSSRLKSFSDWYCQLWAESLGKRLDLENKVVEVGQTPISALGATDQHSTVQLFMEGPNNKYFTFVQIDKSLNEIGVTNPFPYINQFELYSGNSLQDILNFELKATAFALKKNNRDVAILKIPKLDEFHLGQLFYFFQIATVYSSILYNVNCFDQPGVEAGKIATKALLGDPKFSDLRSKIMKLIGD